MLACLVGELTLCGGRPSPVRGLWRAIALGLVVVTACAAFLPPRMGIDLNAAVGTMALLVGLTLFATARRGAVVGGSAFAAAILGLAAMSPRGMIAGHLVGAAAALPAIIYGRRIPSSLSWARVECPESARGLSAMLPLPLVVAAVAYATVTCLAASARDTLPYYDEVGYLREARELHDLLATRGFAAAFFGGEFQPAGRQPLFLLLLSAAGPDGVEKDAVGRAASVAAGVMLVIAVYLAARPRAGDLLAALAAVGMAACAGLPVVAGTVHADTWFILIWLLGWWASVGAFDRLRRAGLAGALVALSYWAKASALLVVPCVVLGWVAHRPMRRAVAGLVAFGLAFGVVVSPIVVRNLRVYGQPFYTPVALSAFSDTYEEWVKTWGSERGRQAGPILYVRAHGLSHTWARVLLGARKLGTVAAREYSPGVVAALLVFGLMGVGATGGTAAVVLSISLLALGSVSTAFYSYMWAADRFLLPFVPILWVLAAWGTGERPAPVLPTDEEGVTREMPAQAGDVSARRRRALVWALAVAATVAGGYLGFQRLPLPLDESPFAVRVPDDYRQLAEFTSRNLRPKDVVVQNSLSKFQPEWLRPSHYTVAFVPPGLDPNALLERCRRSGATYVLQDADAPVTSLPPGGERRLAWLELVWPGAGGPRTTFALYRVRAPSGSESTSP